MSYSYEADIARAFGEFYAKDLLFRDLKSVRWCFTDRTALAEAELEYEERTDPAIYVAFPIPGDLRIGDRYLGADNAAYLTWTTTPWTIPSNLAIAVHPEESYAWVQVGDRYYVVAERLLPRVAQEVGWPDPKVIATMPGALLAAPKARYRHPLPREERAALSPE